SRQVRKSAVASNFIADFRTFGLHSVRKLFTGLASAAFIAWKLTVSNAIANAATIAPPKIHQLILTLYGKSFNQSFIAHQATGKAINAAITTSTRKFFDNSPTILNTFAHTT